jgi:hypothetical protein
MEHREQSICNEQFHIKRKLFTGLNFSVVTYSMSAKVKVKVKFSLYRPWGPLGLREVEAPTFSDIRLTDGGKVVSLMCRLLFIPKKLPGTHFC